jgi:sugar fermentation stimulation protein A
VQRTDCTRFTLANDIDYTYAVACERALLAGVEMLCLGTHISPEEVTISGAIPVVM